MTGIYRMISEKNDSVPDPGKKRPDIPVVPDVMEISRTQEESMHTQRIIRPCLHIPPAPGRSDRKTETYPAFTDPVSGQTFLCIAWGLSQRTFFEYYAFEEFGSGPGSFYFGWIMGETSAYGYFPHAQFEKDFVFIDDPARLGQELLPPLYRTRSGRKILIWERGYPAFL